MLCIRNKDALQFPAQFHSSKNGSLGYDQGGKCSLPALLSREQKKPHRRPAMYKADLPTQSSPSRQRNRKQAKTDDDNDE
eukprot:m.423597 g.423597  ORF g.423597 m.423597 type:complete len:80 (+) comp20211_c4_seq22:1029-1268(+)